MSPTPVTILTGFLGSGKTTVLLNLIPQLPPAYKLALLKNEFGDVAIDSQLAASQSISGVRELLNGCICCNLVGQLGDALEQLRSEQAPDRIVIETSGSAFPATLAMEVNRLIDGANGENFVLDGVVSVVDVENWQGYEDTSVTAKMQAKFTDMVIFNKWEAVSERRFDECLDRLGDLEIATPWVKSDRGKVGKEVLLGIDGALAGGVKEGQLPGHDGHAHAGAEDHQSEVDVLSIKLSGMGDTMGVDLTRLEKLLREAPKDEIYRIKAILCTASSPTDSSMERVSSAEKMSLSWPRPPPKKYILNWAFGRWKFTPIESRAEATDGWTSLLQMTMITAKYESTKWKKKIETADFLIVEPGSRGMSRLTVDKIA